MNLNSAPLFGEFSCGVVKVMPVAASVTVAVSAVDSRFEVGRVGCSLLQADIATSRAQALHDKTNFSFMCSYRGSRVSKYGRTTAAERLGNLPTAERETRGYKFVLTSSSVIGRFARAPQALFAGCRGSRRSVCSAIRDTCAPASPRA